MHKRAGTLVSQLLDERLPEPDSSQRMSGLLLPKLLPTTELSLGLIVSPKNGSVETTTPPETAVGPEGTLPERWLPVTSMSLAPRSAMPIPEKFLSNCAARHELSIVLDRVGFHLEVAYGLRRESFEEHAGAVVVDRVSGDGAPLVSATYMPNAAPEMLLPTTFAFADFWPITIVPATPERLISLERIFVPGASTTSTLPSCL